jgi:hypothetical protein
MTRPELYGDLTRWQGNPIKKDISGKKTKKNRHCDVIKQQISTRIFLTYQCYQVFKRVIKIIFKNIFYLKIYLNNIFLLSKNYFNISITKYLKIYKKINLK